MAAFIEIEKARRQKEYTPLWVDLEEHPNVADLEEHPNVAEVPIRRYKFPKQIPEGREWRRLMHIVI